MIRGCAAMAGMNQRNNDCTVYTHHVAQTDFRRSLRMVRLILTEQKTSNNLTSSVVFSFTSCYLWEPRSKKANPALTESVVN